MKKLTKKQKIALGITIPILLISLVFGIFYGTRNDLTGLQILRCGPPEITGWSATSNSIPDSPITITSNTGPIIFEFSFDQLVYTLNDDFNEHLTVKLQKNLYMTETISQWVTEAEDVTDISFSHSQLVSIATNEINNYKTHFYYQLEVSQLEESYIYSALLSYSREIDGIGEGIMAYTFFQLGSTQETITTNNSKIALPIIIIGIITITIIFKNRKVK